MGDLELDTRLEPVPGSRGRYRAELSEDWRIWGPNGGYMAALALRAAGAEAAIPRPASFAGHFLAVAEFEPVDIEVVALKPGRRTESLRVSIRQHDRPILEALVWTAAERPGLEHLEAGLPDVPPPSELANAEELREGEESEHPFWRNIEQRPTNPILERPPPPSEPCLDSWFRFRPRACFDDPFVDAGRSLLLIDTLIWPAAWRRHVVDDYYAPSLDVTAWFHAAAPEEEWLLCRAESHIANEGRVAGTSRIWSRSGRLLASGGSQLACIAAQPDSG